MAGSPLGMRRRGDMGPGMVRVPEGANEAGSAPEARRPAPSEQRDLRPTVEILEER